MLDAVKDNFLVIDPSDDVLASQEEKQVTIENLKSIFMSSDYRLGVQSLLLVARDPWPWLAPSPNLSRSVCAVQVPCLRVRACAAR